MKDSLGIRRKRLTLTCPNCAHEFQELVARLDDQDQIRCPHCDFLLKTDQFNLTNTIEKALDGFKKGVRGLDKR